jgi:hypothetical protein
MPELGFIAAIQSHLEQLDGLAPEPVLIGPSKPGAADELPAVVISLPEVRRLGGGLGGGAQPMTGVLVTGASIDLAAPVLPGEAPGEAPLELLSPDRRVLTLPHGGLIRADAGAGPLGPADLSASVAGVPRTLVAANPAATQFSVEPEIGRLTFGAALPATGVVLASYHLGSWERTVTQLAGQLLVRVIAASAADVATLSAAVTRSLTRPGAVSGLVELALIALGSIASVTTPASRSRALRFAFEYQHIVDAPARSGGIIGKVPIVTRLHLLRTDRATGAEVESTVIETG